MSRAATTRHRAPGRARDVRMGIDVGGSSIKWVVLEGEQVVDRGTQPTPAAGREAILATIAELVRARDGVPAVGVAIPAVIDAAARSSLVAPNLPGEWSGQPVAPPLTAELGVPVVLCNDARAFALAEWKIGAARGSRDVIAITLGTGVGGAVVVDGRLVRGRQARAGEIGHIPIDGNDARCGCGAIGCLETIAGGVALVRAAASSRLASAPDALTAEAVVEKARGGDPAAVAIVTRAGRAIGTGIASLAIPLNSEVVVVGGGLSGAFDLLRPHIEAPIRERCALTGECRIVAASLGLHAGAIGAALWEETA